MKRFKIYKLNLDGSRVTEHPNFQYDAIEAQPNQPEWGKLERIESVCSEEEKATALEVIEEVKPGYTVPAQGDQPEIVVPDLVFKKYRLRQMFEVVEIDLEGDTDEAFEHKTAKWLASRQKEYDKRGASVGEVLEVLLDHGIDSQKWQQLQEKRQAAKAATPKPTRG